MKTKTITVTKEVNCCDFCGEHEEMSCHPPSCIVCGRTACCKCLHQHLVGLPIDRPQSWATGGYAPHADSYWCCPECSDALVNKINALNKRTKQAMKYMREYMDVYCGWLQEISREVERREKRRNLET